MEAGPEAASASVTRDIPELVATNALPIISVLTIPRAPRAIPLATDAPGKGPISASSAPRLDRFDFRLPRYKGN